MNGTGDGDAGLAALRSARALLDDAARPEQVDRQHRLGKLTARERIAMLTDEHSFRERGGLVVAKEGEVGGREVAPGDGLVAGTARLDGRPVVVSANDFMSLGGSMGSAAGLRSKAMVDLAVKTGVPFIGLYEGGGHRIQGALDSRHFAYGNDSMARQSRMSGWVPTVAALLGPAFAGPVVQASMLDFVVAVRGITAMGMAGPALVKASSGIDISAAELGDPDKQASVGTVHLVVDTEEEALDSIRLYLSYFPSNARGVQAWIDVPDQPDRRDEGLLTAVPADSRVVYDVRDVLELIVDSESFFEISPSYAPNLVTALARLDGRPVGLIANQPAVMAGALDVPASEKSAHFIAVCDAFGLPLIFFCDTPGFLVGPEAEASGLSRRASRPVFELSRATVPRISVVLRKAYGMAYLAMCGGRSFDADLAVAWPTAQISAMGVTGAVEVAYRRDYLSAEDPAKRRQELIDGFTAQTTAIRAAEGFGVDDVIDPRDTRAMIIETLERTPLRRLAADPPRFRAIHPI